MTRLEKCIVHFNIESIDLHNLIQICRSNHLIDGFIYLHNKAFQDYITPLDDVLVMIEPVSVLETNKIDEKRLETITVYCNKLLVYLHCCLCGQAYPYGRIEDDQLSDRVRRTTFDYLIAKRNELIQSMLSTKQQKNSNDEMVNHMFVVDYPVLKIFLSLNPLDFLNVITMAFGEPSFEVSISLQFTLENNLKFDKPYLCMF